MRRVRLLQNVNERLVTSAMERHAISELLQALAGTLECCRIAVDRNQPRSLVALQQRLGVSAESDRRVDERSVFPRRLEITDRLL